MDIYRTKTDNKKALTNQVFSEFTNAIKHGNENDFADILYGRYIVEDFSFSDDVNYWQVHEYFLKVVVPHKIAVWEAGIELSKNDWFFPFIGEGVDLWKDNLYLHDLSKFSANESFGYSFNDFKSKKYNPGFEAAWLHHKNHNEHHPEYWMNKGLILPMPKIYIAEMVADWIGAGKTYGSTIEEWLPNNINKFVFHHETKENLILFLDRIGIDIRSKMIFG